MLSVKITTSPIDGYVKLNLPESNIIVDTEELYCGSPIKVSIDYTLYELSKGVSGPLVKSWQGILNLLGCTDDSGSPLEMDEDFGKCTKEATKRLQKRLFPNDSKEWDGVVGKKTWTGALQAITNGFSN